MIYLHQYDNLALTPHPDNTDHSVIGLIVSGYSPDSAHYAYEQVIAPIRRCLNLAREENTGLLSFALQDASFAQTVVMPQSEFEERLHLVQIRVRSRKEPYPAGMEEIPRRSYVPFDTQSTDGGHRTSQVDDFLNRRISGASLTDGAPPEMQASVAQILGSDLVGSYSQTNIIRVAARMALTIDRRRLEERNVTNQEWTDATYVSETLGSFFLRFNAQAAGQPAFGWRLEPDPVGPIGITDPEFEITLSVQMNSEGGVFRTKDEVVSELKRHFESEFAARFPNENGMSFEAPEIASIEIGRG